MADVQKFGPITTPEVGAPATPATGFVVYYAKTDGLMYSKDDAGTETAMASGGGPATQLDANGTTLDVDAIADGEFLKRVGTTIVSAAAGGGSGLTQPEVMARSFCKC